MALKILGIAASFVLALILIFIFVYAPIRANNLKTSHAKFRELTQANHDNIDKKFNHRYQEAGGVLWHYIDEGNPKGTVILFLHGLPEGFYSWKDVMPLIDKKYRLIAIDMKGYGRTTSADNKNFEWHHVANQTLALMDALGIGKFHVVGHDWGAIISSIMVGDHPDRILSFVRMECDLFSTSNKIATYIKKPQWLIFKNEWLGNYILSNSRWFINTVYNEKRMKSTLSQPDRDYFIYEFSREDVSNAVCQYFLDKNRDLKALMDKIAYNNFPFPVLQLQAERDPAQPVELFEKIPQVCKNVELKWVKNAGHFSNIDQPQQVADAINEFVNRVQK